MKLYSSIFCLVFCTSLIAQQECAPADKSISLFNGKDLSGWEFTLKDQTVDPATVFMVKDATIHITGNPFGYMRTKEQFSDYQLHVEWRWPVEATNSGVYVHMQLPDTISPDSFQSQLMAGNAGDLICVGSADMNERTDKTKTIVTKKTASNEVPVGEWNTMEIVCKGNSIDVIVNGLLQNQATGLTLSKGRIGLQSEGKDIEFRNIYISKL